MVKNSLHEQECQSQDWTSSFLELQFFYYNNNFFRTQNFTG